MTTQMWIVAVMVALVFTIGMALNGMLSARAEDRAVRIAKAKAKAESAAMRAHLNTLYEEALVAQQCARMAMAAAAQERAGGRNCYIHDGKTPVRQKPEALIEAMQRYTEALRKQGYVVNCTIKAPVTHKL